MSKWIGLESEWYWSLVDVQRELEQVMKEVTCIPTRQHVVLDLMSRQVAFHRLNPTLCRFSFLRVALPSVASFFCVSVPYCLSRSHSIPTDSYHFPTTVT